MSQKINIISLGCSKNLVDTEGLMKQFAANGIAVECDAENSDADTVIINTCGFITEAKKESIDTILTFAKAKSRGYFEKLYVMGCLSGRYMNELKNEIPEVDHFFGKFDWKAILRHMQQTYRSDLLNERILTPPSHYAYLKISEGCNRKCSFCTIPTMTGKHVSKPIENIIIEAKNLVNKGVKELLVIAQDLSSYGIDLYGHSALALLIDKLSDIKGVEWIKLHYAYPLGFPLEVLDVMKQKENVCNYLDIALQHASTHMLQRMRRGITNRETKKLIQNIRNILPDIALRTTMIVGHPGETTKDFNQLKTFIKEMRFERLGAFMYSHEENSYAYSHYKDDVPQTIKRQRYEELMSIQQNISYDYNKSKLKKRCKIIIDREEDEYFIGRTAYDSPEVDPEVIIKKKNGNRIKIGEFYQIRIIDCNEFDLVGREL